MLAIVSLLYSNALREHSPKLNRLLRLCLVIIIAATIFGLSHLTFTQAAHALEIGGDCWVQIRGQWYKLSDANPTLTRFNNCVHEIGRYAQYSYYRDQDGWLYGYWSGLERSIAVHHRGAFYTHTPGSGNWVYQGKWPSLNLSGCTGGSSGDVGWSSCA